jgi:hypothetical protein
MSDIVLENIIFKLGYVVWLFTKERKFLLENFVLTTN